MKYKTILALSIMNVFSIIPCLSEAKVLWQIGQADNSAAEFSLAPDNYVHF